MGPVHSGVLTALAERHHPPSANDRDCRPPGVHNLHPDARAQPVRPHFAAVGTRWLQEGRSARRKCPGRCRRTDRLGMEGECGRRGTGREACRARVSVFPEFSSFFSSASRYVRHRTPVERCGHQNLLRAVRGIEWIHQHGQDRPHDQLGLRRRGRTEGVGHADRARLQGQQQWHLRTGGRSR